jgi:hypothetical protein
MSQNLKFRVTRSPTLLEFRNVVLQMADLPVKLNLEDRGILTLEHQSVPRMTRYHMNPSDAKPEDLASLPGQFRNHGSSLLVQRAIRQDPCKITPVKSAREPKRNHNQADHEHGILCRHGVVT